jgi:hypothetical protein
VTTVNGQHVEYVTILIGAAEVCKTTEEAMTTVADFGSQFQTALSALSLGSPDARIYVSSIWDIYQLWSILHTNSAATSNVWWSSFCWSMLGNATSMAQADIDRRARVRQRIIDFNTQLQQVCAQYIHCRFDNNAVFNNAVATTADVSTVDYFHPSLTGQTLLASVSYPASFDFTDNVAPVSSGTIVPAGGGATATLSATDNVGVSGIEYKIDGGAWTRYVSPVFVADGATMTYRAVDVNGNFEASQSLTSTPTNTPTATNTPTSTPTLGPPTATPTVGVAGVGGIAEAVDPATLPSSTAAASGNGWAAYGLAGVVGVLALVAGAGALWRRRRVR